MKNIYFILSFILVGSCVNAQYLKDGMQKTQEFVERTNATVSGDLVDRGVGFWSEDFGGASGDAALGGTITSTSGDWVTSGANGDGWKFSTGLTNGCWSDGTPAPTHPTHSNGFLMLDTDSISCINPDSNPPNSLDTDLFSSVVSPAIDCSAQSAVLLTFYHNYRWCCSELTLSLSVSTDGGLTFPTEFPISTIGANDDMDEMISINLSAIAAGESDVRLRWSWDTASTYYWIIDDIQLSVPADYDLTIGDAYIGDIVESLEYTKVPLDQAPAMYFGARVTNNGGLVSPDATLSVDVQFNGSSVHTGTSTPIEIIQGGDSLLVYDSETYVPTTIGMYDVTFTAGQGGTEVSTEDNEAAGSIEMTEYIYARDDNDIRRGFPVDPTTSYSAAVVYDTQEAGTVYAIDVALTNESAPGEKLLVQMRDRGAANFDVLESSDDVIIWSNNYNNPTAADVTWVTIKLENPFDFAAGDDLMPSITYFGGDGISIGEGQPDEQEQTAFIFGPFGVGQAIDWYFTTDLPMIRLNFDPNAVTTVQELDEVGTLALGQNIPNPAVNSTFINYELFQSGQVTLRVLDITGKEVHTVYEGQRGSGRHTIELDVNQFSSGVYTYVLENGQERLTKKMMVK